MEVICQFRAFWNSGDITAVRASRIKAAARNAFHLLSHLGHSKEPVVWHWVKGRAEVEVESIYKFPISSIEMAVTVIYG